MLRRPNNSCLLYSAERGGSYRFHTDLYYEALTTELEQASPGTIRDVLADIAERLRLGTFPY